jgi:hypothetical protein
MAPLLLLQDNMSAMLLENNGKASSTKLMQHIKIQYFFIKDVVNQGEIEIEHCPTEQMRSDINTKPKQGRVFRQFRGHLMGIPADYNDNDYQPPQITRLPTLMLPLRDYANDTLKECVEVPTSEPTGREPQTDGSVREVSYLPEGKKERAPLKIIGGRRWSPGVYKAL